MKHMNLSFLYAFLAAWGSGDAGPQVPEVCPPSGQCTTEELQSKTSAMLQTLSSRVAGRLGLSDELAESNSSSRSTATDARFLMRATFGPTRQTLAELGGVASYADWIQAQMALPAGSHREFWRKRANVRYEDHMAPVTLRGGGHAPRPKCARGSRWEEVDGGSVTSFLEPDAASFHVLMPGVLLLADTQNCGLGAYDTIKVGGKFYNHSPRLELFENTPENPSDRIVFHNDECPDVERVDDTHCRRLPPDQACWVACGSPGEVANDPFLGFHASFQPRGHSKEAPDTSYDTEFRYHLRYGKYFAWNMLALYGADQLRQRVAWALAQIFPAAPDVRKDEFNEGYLAFYDIFVRNAFGNFRDVLGQVTYSPVMTKYLTHYRNWAYDYDQHYPDENFAREVMQLFTIGLEKLNPDGTPEVDDQGDPVPSYSNADVENFARVFTGLSDGPARSNIEGDRNQKDPSAVRAGRHDVYPKPNLHGGFLGEGYPLCGDLPPRSFLGIGAVYEFRGYNAKGEMGEDIYTVSETSVLFGVLCNAADESGCDFPLRRVLETALPCSGSECVMETVRIIKVKKGGVTGFFEYVPPPCVYHFFYNGVHATKGQFVGASGVLGEAVDVCANPEWPVAGTSCCTPADSTCTNKPKGNIDCTDPSKLTCTARKWIKKQYCAQACSEIGQGYEGLNCSRGLYKEERLCGHADESGVRLKEAQHLCASRGMEVCATETSTGSNSVAACSFNSNGHFVWTQKTCSDTLQVHRDGRVSAHTDYPEPNRFPVQWLGSAPAEGTYDLSVEVSAIFTSAPSKAEFLEELPGMMGAFPPPACTSGTHCGIDSAVCFCGQLDESTVFEFEGRFYKNARSLVNVDGHRFRNPPVFRVRNVHSKLPVTDYGSSDEKLSIAEVDAHLDHLFLHQNTAPFICKLLIQRLVKSNPTPAYVEAVVDAFKSGEYGNRTYSGKTGDLGATVAAILLHPEALEQSGGANEGAMREPLLKIIHFMRAMEYTPEDTDVAFADVFESIGQEQYMFPSVFGFYDPDFKPDRFDEGVFAPEMQVFMGPTAVGLLNGLVSLVANGLMNQKVRRETILRPGLGAKYTNPQGHLTYSAVGAEDDVLDELDLLLTGQRLTDNTKASVREAYNSQVDSQKKLQAAQTVIALSPEFHTYGPVLPQGPAQREVKVSSHDPRDYKAMVMVLLRGGADSWNFIVPLECPLFEEYKQVRSNIAFTESKHFHKVSTAGQTCQSFGIQAAMPTIASLYEDGDAAFVSNIGALFEPTTRDQYRNGGAKMCNGLFSHKHMQANLMTSVCQTPGASPKGVGGRMADALSSGSQQWTAQSFSVQGNNIFSKGFDTNFQVIDEKMGNVRYFYLDESEQVLENITSHTFGNKFCEEYAQMLLEQIHAADELGDHVEAAELLTDFDTSTGSLARQLHQVAKLIKTREERKAERDFFFVQLNKWDMHHNLKADLPEQLAEVDGAVKEFVEELKALQVFDSVTMVTHSDFGRTLTSNGDGADHAWAGQHFVVGGAINGGRVYNDFPSTLLEHSDNHTNEYDVGRGRLIPKYPWESVMVPIAKWMGVEDGQMSTVFPNLGNFNSSHIISSVRGDPLFPGQ